MELIKLPRVRLNQLHWIAEESIRICSPFTVLVDDIANVTGILGKFTEGQKKPSASAAEKLMLDKKRDRIIMGFLTHIKAEMNFPYTKDQLVYMNDLFNIKKKYTGVTRISQTEETAAVDTMLEELNGINAAAFNGNGLKRWILLIKEANDNYKNAIGEYIDNQTDTKVIISASKYAPVLIGALEELYKRMFGHIMVSNEAEMIKAYQNIEVLVSGQ
ncbi:DUF6261 family protein [Carboxylicivirga sp. N1Y90]|uniref:DUF6261 family protein n=1 Tax=Carboxylicivirga fragile TaxID=3417571 RepID=UPI003D350E74|nr:hypothetical protein [Marinilabiliaceae bacterium N1Y90]